MISFSKGTERVYRQVILLLLIFFALPSKAQLSHDRARIDSIFGAIKIMEDDTHKVNYINHIYSDYLWRFNLPEAYNQLKSALRLSQNIQYSEGEFRTYNSMAGFCIRVGAPDYSLQHRLHALEVAERMHDSVKMAVEWTGIGIAYQAMSNSKLALDHFLKALPVIEQSGNKDRIARIYSQMSGPYHVLGNDSMAVHYLEESLRLREEINYEEGRAASLIMLRELHRSKGETNKVLEYAEKLLALEQSRKNNSGIAGAYIVIGNIYEDRKDLSKASGYYHKSLELALKENDKAVLRDVYRALASVIDRSGNTALSYKYFKQHVQLKDSLAKLETEKQAENLKALFDIESKNHEIELLSKDNEINKLEIERNEKDITSQKRSLMGLGALLLITSALAGLIFYGYRDKKRTAKSLALQKKIIEEKNNDILDSMRYAEKIQQAMQPSHKVLTAALPDSFVLYKPKDIVSGDFYWFAQRGSKVFVAAADCTGHGVPGALMSMVGLNFLNQLVNGRGLEDTSEILDELHRNVLSALNESMDDRSSKDGMDIALLCIDTSAGIAHYSGAVRPLCYINQDGLQVIKGDRFSIGGIKEIDGKPFGTHTIKLEGTHTFYLFSDGYADQFGGPQGKKFMMKNFQSLLLNMHTKPMAEQKQELDTAIEEWKKGIEQIDDILVIGVRVQA